jgi:hypothetical protein
MAFGDLKKEPYRLIDPRQIRIYDHLSRLVGMGAAAFFYDACQLMDEAIPYRATSHLVAHMLREVESSLRSVLEPITARSKGTGGPEAHKANVLAILTALNIPNDDPVAERWLKLVRSRGEAGFATRAHREALALPRPIDSQFVEFFQGANAIFDLILSKLEVKYLEYHKLLDGLAAKDFPTSADIKTLRNNIPNSLVTSSYFFKALKSPSWVEPLRISGVFKEIPYRVVHENGISCPAWPAADYLKRSAAAAPDEVARVLLEAPDIDNWLALADLAELASILPNAAAAEWANRMTVYLVLQDYLSFSLPLKLGGLVSSLARRAECSSAVKLAETILQLIEDPRQDEKTEDDLGVHNILEPRARFDHWDYEQILKESIPDLVEAVPDQALNLLCDLLDRAVLLSDRSGESRRPKDLSYIWRPAIEEHQQNLDLGLKHLLVTAVRSAAEQIGKKNPSSVPAVIQALEQRGKSWYIFQRIALHLLRLLPDCAPGLVRERLLDRRLFDFSEVHHEYFLLQKECFGRLNSEDQRKVLAWIDNGPSNHEENTKSWEKFIGRSVTPEEDQKSIKQWKQVRLGALREYLDESWKAKYDTLVDNVGESEHPEFLSFTEGGALGPHSPKDQRELKEMTPSEAVAYLLEWEPSADPMRGASPEGLGRQLTAVVEELPEQYAAEAAEFKRLLEPTYIRAAIQGFEGALKQHRKFTWAPVLDLCQWLRRMRGRFLVGRSSTLKWIPIGDGPGLRLQGCLPPVLNPTIIRFLTTFGNRLGRQSNR